MAFGADGVPHRPHVLGSAILAMAATQETILQGMVLLALYTFGLALPFLIISLFINYLLEFMRELSGALKFMNIIAGVLLILVGIFYWDLITLI
ncbi:MAG: cytochrome c biogenesis protein CcdA [Desulfobacterales bacterium]